MKLNRVLFLFFLAGSLPARSEDAAPAVPTAKAVGLVYRVEGGKAPLFLCGSVHLLNKKDYPLPDGYETAYTESTRIVFEIPPAELSPEAAGAAMAKYGVLKEGTLDDLLTDEARTALKGWARENGVPMGALSKLPPWMVGIMISQQSYAAAGMKAQYGLDVHFNKRVEKDGKAGEGLESLEQQLGMLSGFDQKIQNAMIVQSIEESKEADKELAKLLDAWRAGDAEALNRVMTESLTDFPEVEKVLLHDRNARWIPKLKSYLSESTATMIIVGAGHLCGPHGLVALLEKEGFAVKPVKP